MRLIGRWANVREWGDQGWGQPWMLDRKWGRMLPYACEEWWRSPSGLWVPTIRGGAFSGSQQAFSRLKWGIEARNDQGALNQGVNFGSNYVFQTGGTGIGYRFTPPLDETLNELFFRLNTYGGTAANVNDLDWEVRNGETGTTNFHTVASGAAVASGSFDPASATGWLRITGISAALTKGNSYWFILGDADGNGSHFAQFHVTWLPGAVNFADEEAILTGHFHTNGFSGGATAVAGAALCCAVMASGRVYGGAPWGLEELPTSGTYQRGLLIDSTVFSADVQIYGVLAGITAQPNFSGLNLWTGTDGPTGGSPINTTAPIGKVASSGFPQGFQFTDFQQLDAATQYRLTFTYGTASAQPIRMSIGTGTHANLAKLMPGGGGAMWTQDTASAWVNTTDAFPKMVLLLENFLGTGGPGSGGLKRANMSGGFL
jgi:hypothetical protein